MLTREQQIAMDLGGAVIVLLILGLFYWGT
jgi:hypothetical protein